MSRFEKRVRALLGISTAVTIVILGGFKFKIDAEEKVKMQHETDSINLKIQQLQFENAVLRDYKKLYSTHVCKCDSTK